MGSKNNMQGELEKIVKLIGEVSDELKTKASQQLLEELRAEMREKNNKIDILEARLAIAENTIRLLTEKCDANEQYSRRPSLRINSIPLPDGVNAKESADVCREKVKEVIRESGAVIPDTFIDRAHRVGKVKVNSDGTRNQQMIVKFTTWYHRTLLYRNRKTLKNTRVYLDLTRDRFKLLKKAQAKYENDARVDFIFADVNCALCIKFKNGVFRSFNTESQLDEIVGLPE